MSRFPLAAAAPSLSLVLALVLFAPACDSASGADGTDALGPPGDGGGAITDVLGGGGGGGGDGGGGGGGTTDVAGGGGGGTTDVAGEPLEPDPTDPTAPFSEQDLDGDGIPDQLEMEGFMWDPMERRFTRWNLDPNVRRYFTNPNQASSDGDPYSDAMEITGIQMDTSVLAPGDDPLVPAMPRIIALIDRYEVTLLEEITLTSGRSLARETTWGTETAQSYSSTKEESRSLAVGVSTSTSAGFPAGASVEVGLEVTAQETQSESFTTSSSTAYSQGGGTAVASEWSRASTVDTGAAAQLSLIVSFYNEGNAAAVDIVPTFDLVIGDRLIRTFVSDDSIVRLDPGQSFQREYSPEDLVLSLDELAMIESGAPITLRMSQARFNVARMVNGVLQAEETWNDYIGMTRPISTRVRLDDGEGGVNDFLIYAGGDDAEPTIRLRDAIIAGALGRDEPGGLTASVFTVDRTERRVSLDGWTLMLDPASFELVAGRVADPAFDIMSLPLVPRGTIRLMPGYREDGTAVHYAAFDVDGNLVVAATDVAFAGSALTVTAQSDDGPELALVLQDDGFFRTTTPPAVPRWGGIVTVRARNPVAIANGTAGATLELPNGRVLTQGTGSFSITSLDPFGDPAEEPLFSGQQFDVFSGRVRDLEILGDEDGVCSNQGAYTSGGRSCVTVCESADVLPGQGDGICPPGACDTDPDCVDGPTEQCDPGDVCVPFGMNRCMPRLPSWQTRTEGLYLRGGRDNSDPNRLVAELRAYYDDFEGEDVTHCHLVYEAQPVPQDIREVNREHPALVRCNDDRWQPLTDFPPDAYGGQPESNDHLCEGNRENSIPLFGDRDRWDGADCGPVDYAFKSSRAGIYRLTVVRFPNLGHCQSEPGTTRTIDYEYVVYDLTHYAP